MANNVNIVHVNAIEGLAEQISEHLKQLVSENSEQYNAKNEAEEYLHNYEINQIKGLRDVFE